MTVILALSYSGRDEIVRMVRGLARAAREGKCDPEQIDERAVAAELDTRGVRDPDVMARFPRKGIPAGAARIPATSPTIRPDRRTARRIIDAVGGGRWTPILARA